VSGTQASIAKAAARFVADAVSAPPKKRRRSRMPIVPVSTTAAQRYARWLRAMVQWLGKRVRAQVLTAYAAAYRDTPDDVLAVTQSPLQARSVRTDADDADVYRAISEVGEEWSEAYPVSRLVGPPGQMLATTNRVASAGLARQLAAAGGLPPGGAPAVNVIAAPLGIDLFAVEPALVTVAQTSLSENVKLIQNVQAKYLQQIQQVVAEGIAEGTRPETMAKLITERTGIASRRATLIARDQTEKAQSAITQARQRAAGVTSYIWRTSRDDRVRPEHHDREGVTFRWDTPPEDGPPGVPINCRCTAEPVLE